MVFALFYGFTFLITAPLTVVFAAGMFGVSRLGTVSGLISRVHLVFGRLGALVGALIFDQWGSYDGVFVLMLILPLAATGITLALGNARPKGMPRVVQRR